MAKSHRKGNRTRLRDHLRTKAIRAKERFKALALFGSMAIGFLVDIDEYAHGMGSTFSTFAGVVAFAMVGAVFGLAALGMKVDKKYHDR